MASCGSLICLVWFLSFFLSFFLSLSLSGAVLPAVVWLLFPKSEAKYKESSAMVKTSAAGPGENPGAGSRAGEQVAEERFRRASGAREVLEEVPILTCCHDLVMFSF